MSGELEAMGAAVREKLGEQAVVDEAELQRFLVGCDNVVPKAAHVYAKSRQWREAEKVDGILEDERMKELEPRVRRYQQYVEGLEDRDGRPVAVWRAGRVPVRGMMEDIGCADVLRTHIYLKERSLQRARERGHATHVLVLDLDQLGMAQMDREGLAALKSGIEIEQRYYPETFERIVIVRAPWIWSAMWNMVNPWLNDNDRAKILISSDPDPLPTLAQFLAPEQTPDFLGGAFRVPLDGLGGPNVPAAAAGALEVGAGLKHSLHLPLSEPELALSWCWSTDGYDLACAVYFRPEASVENDAEAKQYLAKLLAQKSLTELEDGTTGIVVEPESRHDSHLAPVLGSWIAPGPGTLEIAWSNEYSWTTAKPLKYEVSITAAETSSAADDAAAARAARADQLAASEPAPEPEPGS